MSLGDKTKKNGQHREHCPFLKDPRDLQLVPQKLIHWICNSRLAGIIGDPKGNRTPVFGVRGQRPNR